jgi:hypothetical protein
VAKVGTSNHDRTISLKAAVRSCINNNNNNNKVMIKIQNIHSESKRQAIPAMA